MTSAPPIPKEKGSSEASSLGESDRLRSAAFVGVVVVILVGLFLRIRPMIRGTGLWTTPIDADNGVYYGATALMWQGVNPYSEFTFMHPMVVAYLHAPAGLVSHLSVDTGFVVARWTAVAFGLATMALVAAVLWRKVGKVAAVAGVAIYAVYPEIVNSDRGPFLEPIQNMLGALLILVWTSRWSTPRWRMLISGVLLGSLLATKYTGGFFLLACLVSLPGDDLRTRVRHGLEALASTCVSFLLLMSPWFVSAPRETWNQTVSAHLGRGDGLPMAMSDRMITFFDLQGGPERLRPLAAVILLIAVCIVAVLFGLRGKRLGRFVGALFLADVALLLLVSQYWPQYNAILALPLALMAGWVAERCFQWVRPGRPSYQSTETQSVGWRDPQLRARTFQVVGAVGLAVVVLTVLFFSRSALRGSQVRSELIPELRVATAELPEGCVVGLPAKTLLAINELPPKVDGRYLLDPYGISLVETEQASMPAPSSTIEALDACTSVLADPDWVDALGPVIESRGYRPAAELRVEGRLAVVYLRE